MADVQNFVSAHLETDVHIAARIIRTQCPHRVYVFAEDSIDQSLETENKIQNLYPGLFT